MAEDESATATSSADENSPSDATLAGASRAESDAYLRKQRELIDLQIADLTREDRVRHWSLRVRHISDVLKLGFEFSFALVVCAIIAALVIAVWSAVRDKGLVIEAFNVPSDLAARGLSGQVVAAQLQDRLAAMQAQTVSVRPAGSYSNNWGNDIKVQIPDTGISVGEFNRYLRQYLGHETHISGDIFHAASGLALTARVGESAQTLRGADIDVLLQRAAETIYRRSQPYRYAIYLRGQDRRDEARAVLTELASYATGAELAWADAGLALNLQPTGRFDEAEARGLEAVRTDPDNQLAFDVLSNVQGLLSHEQGELQSLDRSLAIGGGAFSLTPQQNAASRDLTTATRDEMLGDFAGAVASERQGIRLPEYQHVISQMRIALPLDLAFLHDAAGARAAFAALPPPNDPTDVILLHVARGSAALALAHWREALSEFRAADAMTRQPIDARYLKAALLRSLVPGMALALAMNGDTVGADPMIATTPLDCDLCIRIRGRIAAAKKDWKAASAAFARASHQAPSIPFADTEWGRMLLSKGDVDAAIAKFSRAHAKGPQFADPLELWGEALIAQNRSQAALIQFAESAKAAPDWGRLHLKWGEALRWSGDKAGARKQFAIAATLDLTQAERDELARMRGEVS